MLFVLGLTFLLEFIIASLLPKEAIKARNISVVTVMVVMFFSSAYIVLDINFYSSVAIFIGVFRVINLTRVAYQRLNPKELASRYTKSALVLALLTLIVIAMGYLDIRVSVTLIAGISLLVSAVLLIHTASAVYFRGGKDIEIGGIKNLPTVSVCIPARNETESLPACIESLLSSGYPKLEILVLDDCSHDKTPAVIKEYAQQGVRFISGHEPDKDWLSKNQAMNKLFDESRGDIVVFAGVDVRFTTETVQRLVEILENGYDMIGVLPLRTDTAEASVFIQPLRYWWELAIPRKFRARPPVLSTCWAIRKQALIDIGEFDGVRHSVQPEAYFAKSLKDRYKLIISGTRFGITSVKNPSEQFDTAIRTRYPQLKRSPEFVAVLILVEVFVFMAPIYGMVYGSLNDNILTLILSSTSVACLIVVNLILGKLSVAKSWYSAVITLPFLVLEEWYILIRSMLAYEFGKVIWKERNICLPVLQVEKHLPKI